MKIAVVTVNYKHYKLTQEFLDCLERQTDHDFHVYVADLTLKKDRKNIVKRKFLTVIKGPNKGYGSGINLGLKQAQKDGINKFIVINNDVEFKKDFIAKCRKSLDANPGGLQGGKIYYAIGYEYHKERYRKTDLGRVFWYAGGKVDWKNVYVSHRGVDEVDKRQYDKLEKTDFVTGCLMLLDDLVIEKTGYFDESYFMYYEDADFCTRALNAGVKLLYDPSVMIWHKNGQSTDGSGSDFQVKFIEKNRFKYGLKYAPWRTKIHLILNRFSLE